MHHAMGTVQPKTIPIDDASLDGNCTTQTIPTEFDPLRSTHTNHQHKQIKHKHQQIKPGIYAFQSGQQLDSNTTLQSDLQTNAYQQDLLLRLDQCVARSRMQDTINIINRQ